MPVLELPDWTPAVQDVALHLLARTRMPNGSLAGTFNQQTSPTDTQVMAIIQTTVRLHAPKMGDVPDALKDSATALLALQAAIVVEQSYYLEQTSTDVSPYKQMCEDAKWAKQEWIDAAKGDTPNGARTASLPVGTLYPGFATGTY
jgi:hypothetical protein